eukprot:6347673-Ditylum_brightwellii.AAC.1
MLQCSTTHALGVVSAPWISWIAHPRFLFYILVVSLTVAKGEGKAFFCLFGAPWHGTPGQET